MTLAFDRLPEHYRAVDATLDAPLERFLSAPAAQLQEVLDLLDRIEDLADPEAAEVEWLGWLAQFVVDITGLAETQARSLLAGGAATRGSLRAVRAAVQALLTGERYVNLVRHYGDDWTVAIITLTAETPVSGAQVVAAADVEKPAGVLFVHDFGLTWDELEATFPTWTDIEAAGSWEALVP